MTNTTAQYRLRAQDAEKALDWTEAAYCWGTAIECYPNGGKGALAQHDIAKMTARRDAARRSAWAEVKHTALYISADAA